MKPYLYRIKAITNLHVGSGVDNEGVIDKLIQRDVLSELPVINGSSLKGALRNHFGSNEFVDIVFGNENDSNNNKKSAGSYRFFDANLLALPVRSDKSPYLMATSASVISDFLNRTEAFGVKPKVALDDFLSDADELYVNKECYSDGYIEDEMRKTKSKKMNWNGLSKIVDSHRCAFLPDNTFHSLCDDSHLPVMSRNCVDEENGNLWYEQVLPRYSCLYFILLVPENDKYIGEFNKLLTKDVVQIGANASVGYGYCKISLMEL